MMAGIKDLPLHRCVYESSRGMPEGGEAVVSVIIPFYKRWEHLKNALQCVSNQTYKHIQLILVDDASPRDLSQSIKKQLKNWQGNFQLYRLEENGGPGAARKVGHYYATGKYIQFLDSDDFIKPQKLQKQVELLEARPNLIMTYALTHTVAEGDGFKGGKILGMTNESLTHIFPQVFERCLWQTSSCLWRSQWVSYEFWHPLRAAEDILFDQQAGLLNQPIAKTDSNGALVFKTDTSTGISKNLATSLDSQKDILRSYKLFLSAYRAQPISIQQQFPNMNQIMAKRFKGKVMTFLCLRAYSRVTECMQYIKELAPKNMPVDIALSLQLGKILPVGLTYPLLRKWRWFKKKMSAFISRPSSGIRTIGAKDIILVSRRWKSRGSHSDIDHIFRFFPGSRNISNNDAVKSPYFLLKWMADRAGQKGYTSFSLGLELKTMYYAFLYRPRIVHFLYVDHDYHYSWLVLKLLGIKIAGNTYFSEEEYSSRMPSKRHLRRLDLLITAGEAQSGYLGRYVPCEKLAHIPLGVDANFFKPPAKQNNRFQAPFRLLHVGLNRRDIGTLKAVYLILKKRHPDAVLEFVLGDFAKPLFEGVPDCIFHPFLEDERLLDVYQNASVLLLPLLEGASSQTLNEALATGLPIVTNSLPNLEEYAGSECIKFAAPKNARQMADACSEWLDNPQSLASASVLARSYAMQLDFSKVRRKLVSLYRTRFKIGIS